LHKSCQGVKAAGAEVGDKTERAEEVCGAQRKHEPAHREADGQQSCNGCEKRQRSQRAAQQKVAEAGDNPRQESCELRIKLDMVNVGLGFGLRIDPNTCLNIGIDRDLRIGGLRRTLLGILLGGPGQRVRLRVAFVRNVLLRRWHGLGWRYL